MNIKDFYWSVFSCSGNISSYLAYKLLETGDNSKDSDNEIIATNVDLE